MIAFNANLKDKVQNYVASENRVVFPSFVCKPNNKATNSIDKEYTTTIFVESNIEYNVNKSLFLWT